MTGARRRCGPCGKGGGVTDGSKPGGEHERLPSAAKPDLWQRVVEQLGTAVAAIDPAGRIVAANPAAEQLLGRTARGDDDRCLRGDGRLVPVSWSASPLTDDDVCDGSGVVRGMVVLIEETGRPELPRRGQESADARGCAPPGRAVREGHRRRRVPGRGR
ncbi:PAS domain-containing protein [Streptomyces sp. tea 10]|nr:PAS domain-containing protein [Streptomyces sp. tea 10]